MTTHAHPGESLSGDADECCAGRARADRQPDSPELVAVRERQAGIAASQAVEAVAAGSVDQLDETVPRAHPLHVVLMAVQDQAGVAGQRAPEPADARVVAVDRAG